MEGSGPKTGRMVRSRAHSHVLLRLDRFVVFVAFLLLGALAMSSPLLAAVNRMRIAGCRTACSTSLVAAGSTVIMAGCIAVTVMAFLGLLLLPRPNRYLWWLPCSALAVGAAIVLLGNHLIDLGVGT